MTTNNTKIPIHLIGLGNTGQIYEKTRHNAGVMLVQQLCQQLTGNDFSVMAKSIAKFKVQVVENKSLVLFRSLDYMNNSGEIVTNYLNYRYHLASQSTYPWLWLAFDDLDLPLGSYKIQFAKGPKDHNGYQSVVSALGSDQFGVIRLGIENRRLPKIPPGEQYVLEKFSQSEYEQLQSTIKSALQTWLEQYKIDLTG